MKPNLRTLAAVIGLIGSTAVAAWTGTQFSIDRGTPRTEIFRGVFYRSFPRDDGMVHLVEIDLSRPGIELFVTPLDPVAVESGYQYRLDYVRNVARSEGLAVAINGTLFSSDSYLLPMIGDFAASVDSIVSSYEVSHLHPRDFMLWFDAELTPHVELARPIPPGVLNDAKWGIGGQGLVDAKLKRNLDLARDHQSVIAINPDTRRMWLAVFESATDRIAAEQMFRVGARYVMFLDGGNSTSLYFGGRARGVPSGLRFGGQRPVATVIGIRAEPILDPI
jgi:hypothetical protein